MFHGFNLIIGFFTFCIILFDVFSNFRILIFCRWDKFFYFQDPHLFRIEYISQILLAIYYILFPVLFTQIAYYVNYDVPTEVTMFITESALYWLMFNQIGIPLILTIIRLIKSKMSCFQKQEKVKVDEIHRFFLPPLDEKFEEFAKSEWFFFFFIL
jgi:hypothetical protein